MSDYIKSTNFTSKDTLPSGNANKIVKGTELDTEFTAIASAISSKTDSFNPTLTGIPLAPTASSGTNTTQIATTAFVIANVPALATAATTATYATQITNSGGWSVTPSGTKLYFNYNGVNKGSLDSSGNFIVVGNVTAYGTP